MAIVFKNNASTTLSAALSSSATSITVADATKLPSITGDEYFFCSIDDGSNIEIVKVTGVSSNTLTIVRAQDNTTAQTFSSGDLIEQRLTAAVLETFPQLDVGELTADEFVGDLRGAVIFKAKAGEDIDKGEVVYVSGISGNTPVVALADADDANKMPAFGLALESVSLNASLAIVTFGTISGVDTDTPGFSLGDTLYVSTTPGALTNSPPAGESSLLQNIGKVQRVHVSSGSIKVGGAGRTNAVPNLNDGNIFIGNASNQATTASLNTKIEDYLDANGTTFPDSVKAQFGTSNDLQIYHDGTNSYIDEVGTGGLNIRSNGGRIALQKNDGTFMIQAINNGNVVLYSNGQERLRADGTGIDVTGTAVADNLHINSTSGQLKISRLGSSDNGIYWDRLGTQDASIHVASNEHLNIDNNFGNPINLRIGADGSETTYLSVNTTGIDVTGVITSDGLTVDGLAQISAQTNGTYALRVGDAAGSSGSVVGIGKIGINPQSAGTFTYTGTEIRATENAAGDYRARLSFHTRGSTSDVEPLERLRIDQTGDISFYEDTGTTAKLFWDASAESLGIGTTSPSQALHVSSSSDTPAIIESTDFNSRIEIKDNSGSSFIENRGGILNLKADSADAVANSRIEFSIDGSEKVRIDSTGNISADTLTLTAGNDDLTITSSADDWYFRNAEQNNGFVLYNGTGGIDIQYAGTSVQEWDSNGGTNLISGGFRVGGQEVITSGRNLTNIGTISSGAISTSANLDMNANSIIDIEQLNGVGDTGWLDFNMDTDNIYPQSTADNQTVLGSVTHMNFVGDSNANGTGGKFYWGYGVNSSDSGTFTETMELDRSGNLTVTGEVEATALDINGNGDISGNLTLGGYLAGPATFTIDPAAVGDNTGTVVIAGNLQVDGTTTTVNSTTVNVSDKAITLGYDATTDAANNNAGIVVYRPETSNAQFLWNETNERFEINRKLNIGQQFTVDASGTNDTMVEIGAGTASNHYAYIDLIGDATYTDYGLRIIRNNSGANTSSVIYHRGTGDFVLETQEAANLKLRTSGADALTINSSGNATFAGTINSGAITSSDNITADGTNAYILANRSATNRRSALVFTTNASDVNAQPPATATIDYALGVTDSDEVSGNKFFIKAGDTNSSGSQFFLDSSGATFAGTINSGAITASAPIKVLQPSSSVTNELLVLEADDPNADIIMTDNTGSVRLRTSGSGDFTIFTGGSATSENASGATTALTIDQSQNSTFAGTISSGAITTTGALTIDVDNQANGALRIEANQTNPDNDLYFAQEIISTLSGTTPTTGDREQGGIYIDLNSSATGGDTSNEHRVYGVHLDVDSTGDADLVYGVYSNATATPTTGTTTNVYGGYFHGEDNGGAGNVTTVIGVQGTAVSDNSNSDPNSMFAGYFKSYNLDDSGNIGQATAVYGELEIPSGTADIYGTSYIFRAEYDNNGTVAQTNTTYLYYGNYSGVLPTNAYGVYIVDAVDNYFAGAINSGQVNATTTADATPAIIATNTGGVSSVIQRWVGSTGALELGEISAEDYSLLNKEQNNGLVIYNASGGVEVHYNGSAVQSWDSTGGTNLVSGGFKVGGTEVISSSGNLTNIGTISSGAITSTLSATDGNLITFNNSNGEIGSIETQGDEMVLMSVDRGLRIRTSTANSIIPVGTARTNLDATIDLGSSGARFKDLYLSGTANVGAITSSGASTFSNNVNIDRTLYLDARYDGGSGDDVLAFKDSAGNYSIRQNVNDGNGNYSISIGYSGAGSGEYAVTGDGVGKLLFGGHGRDGAVSLNAAPTGTAGNNISFSIGLLVDSSDNTIRVGASANGTGLDLTAGTKVFDASGNAFATSYSVGVNEVISSTRVGTFPSINLDDQIISTGDTNTYMQFHAADQWRVVTGGSERLEVNNTRTTINNGYLQVTGSTSHLVATTTATAATTKIGLTAAHQSAIVFDTSSTAVTGTSRIYRIENIAGNRLRIGNPDHPEALAINNGGSVSSSGDFVSDGLTIGSWGVGSNTGQGRIGKASDRPAGAITNQIGGGSSAYWEIVDYAWSTVLAQCNNSGDFTAYRDFNTSTGGYEVNGTTVIDSSRNLTIDAKVTNNNGTILDTDGSSNYIKGGNGGSGILYTEASTFYVNNPMHLNVGRGVCYFENNANSNSNGAGVTLRTSVNPTTGSIFDVRSSGQACRLFSGQSLSSAGTNPFYVGTPATGNEHTGTDYEILLNTNGDITAEGNITAYGTVSDIRQKENIEQIDKPIERLEKIKGITFNYKKKSEDERLMGVIAQDLLEDDILKLAVYEQEDFKAEDDDPLKHTYGVRYEHLTAILIEAVKEQQEQIESLKNEINNLKGEK